MRLTLPEAMQRRDMSPEVLAEKSGIHKATVYRLKNGEIANPSHDTVQKLELALRLKRGTLVFGQVMARTA